MKCCYWLLLFVKCVFTIPSCSDVRTKSCLCFPGVDLEIQCFKNSTNKEKIVLHIKPVHQTLKIDCYDLQTFQMDLLPQLELREISRLEMFMCPLAEDFQHIATHFSIQKLQVVQFEHTNSEITLTGRNFRHLNLTRLKLNLLYFGNLEENVFSNLSDLYSLEMQRNRNLILPPRLLRDLVNLKALDLSQNNLTTVPPDFFKNLEQLRSLHLWGNNLKQITSSTFQYLRNLTLLELSYNNIEFITPDALNNLKQLLRINLSGNQLRTLSSQLFHQNSKLKVILLESSFHLEVEDFLFANLPNLEELALTSTRCKQLPKHIFANSTKISILNLSNNSLETINFFQDLAFLKKLYLQNNKITEISGEMFMSLSNLEELYLYGNQILKISFDTFSNSPKLRILNLANNNISNQVAWSVFRNFPNLENLNLHKNFLTNIEEFLKYSNLSKLRRLVLSNNQIEELNLLDFQPTLNLSVNLDFNPITKILFHEIKTNIIGKTTFCLKNVSIVCDCSALELYNFLKNANFESYDFFPKDISCQKPQNMTVSSLNPNDLLCKFGNNSCPSECSCNLRSFDNSLVINCSNLNLSEFPKMESKNDFEYFKQIELHLENNNLTTLDYMRGYENVTKLYLSRNKLQQIDWLPPKLQVLHIDYNNLTILNDQELNFFQSNKVILKLDENLWMCVCQSANFSTFLKKHNKMVNVQEVKCFDNPQRLLVNLSESDLCPDQLLLIVITSNVLLILLFIIFVILFYRNQQTIKVWLFSKHFCLWWVTEDEVYKNKTYDAFISYSHKDEDFVVRNLLPILESAPNPYKLCVHFRNFVPGEFISTQITNSICDSKRTVVVLSKNFLESVWGKIEFRTAHTQAMTEEQTRLIIILYGNVQIEDLDEELKTYVKTHSYLEWGDPYFWRKLRYALPHSRNKQINENINIDNRDNTLPKSHVISISAYVDKLQNTTRK